jgi:3-dehydroquinate dehydratase I
MLSTMLTRMRKPAIVAVIGSLPDFEEIGKLSSTHFDLCELRIDLLYRTSAELESHIEDVACPKIATVRDPNEGGANALPEKTRLELYQRWLPLCDLIDVELRSLSRFSGLVEQAESAAKGVIISFHDFEKTPSLEELQEKVDRCRLKKNQIFKVASKVAQWADVETLIRLLQQNPQLRIAAMGMGEFGKLSRLVLARLGSCLVYGSVGQAVAQGQWPVNELARLLSEMTNGN